MKRRRRGLQDISVGEQDPGKDLFAILFLSFYMLVLVGMTVNSLPPPPPQAPPVGGGKETVQAADSEIVAIGSRAGQIFYAIGETEYPFDRLLRVVNQLPVFAEQDGLRLLRVRALAGISAIEWENAKRRLAARGYPNVTLLPTEGERR